MLSATGPSNPRSQVGSSSIAWMAARRTASRQGRTFFDDSIMIACPARGPFLRLPTYRFDPCGPGTPSTSNAISTAFPFVTSSLACRAKPGRAQPCPAWPFHAQPALPHPAQPCPAMPGRAIPRLPCHTPPSQAQPRHSVPALPGRDLPCLAEPCRACQAAPRRASPRRTVPALPRHTAPNRTLPDPDLPCHAQPAVPSRAML